MTNLFDEWNYDSAPRATLSWATGRASVERFGVIGWSWFCSNPAYFCTMVHAQSFEDFLAQGPSTELEWSPPKEVVHALRAQVLSRSPGPSTYVDVVAMAREGTRLDDLSWTLDGELVGFREVIGPDVSVPIWRHGGNPLRLLVTPGAHRMGVSGNVVSLSGNVSAVRFASTQELTSEPARGTRLALRLAVDFESARSEAAWSGS